MTACLWCLGEMKQDGRGFLVCPHCDTSHDTTNCAICRVLRGSKDLPWPWQRKQM